MKFDISRYNYNTNCAMHCKTEEELETFLDYLYDNGYDHLADCVPTRPSLRKNYYGNDHVFWFNNGTWSNVDYAKTVNATILEWSTIVAGESTFTKADLKTGDVVLRRNGEIEIVNYELGTLICKEGGYNLLSYFRNDLTHIHTREWDIIEVRRPKEKCDCCFDAMGVSRRGTLVYERKEPEEMTLAEVCRLLGKEIKIIP